MSPFHSNEIEPNLHVEYFDFHIKSVLITPWMLESEDNRRILLLLDEEFNAHLYNPHASEHLARFVQQNYEQIYFQTASINEQTINGYTLTKKVDETNGIGQNVVFGSSLLWSKTWLDSSEQMTGYEFSKRNQLVVNAMYQTGERGALLKYLNPHLMVISTIERSNSVLHIYLFDGITGQIVLHSFHDDCRLTTPLTLLLYENKLLYSYFNSLTMLTEVIVHDLWFSDPNLLPTKERSAADGYILPDVNSVSHAHSQVFSSFNLSVSSRLPYVTSQAYNFEFVIEQFLTVTQSRYSVANKWIVVQLQSGSIMRLDAQFVNSRRPISNELTTANRMEKLVNYRKYLPYQSLWVLSQGHQMYTNTIQQLECISTPIESTSLIFGSGLDLFFRRITPSANFDTIPEDFDFLMLFLILGGVVVAIFVARKWAKQKKLKKEWK